MLRLQPVSLDQAPTPPQPLDDPREAAIAAIDTPAVVIDLERLDGNLRRMAEIARRGRIRLRPHAKSHKLPQLAHRQLALGGTGLTVAKLGEAEVFVDHGIDDILIAYPLWGAAKLRRLCALAKRARISVSADSAVVVAGLAEAAAASGVEIPVLIEIDTGFERCGVAGLEQALALAREVVLAPSLEFAGVMSFAGQSYQQRSSAGIDTVARDDITTLLDVAAGLRRAGLSVPSVSAGSTPTAARVAGVDGITEIRPGAYALSDRDQVALGWGTLEDCAVTVLMTVVSRPTPTRAIVDAGSKALSSDTSVQDGHWGTVVGRPELTFGRMTEEHGMLDVPPGVRLDIGTQLRVIPNHGCGTINMHDEVVAVHGDGTTETWTVAARAKLR